MSELRFEGVTVRYGTRRRGMTAVDSVDLTVPANSVVGLVGESGSGKSTLARAAVGLTPLTAGRILLGGRPIPHKGRRPLQMVFQDPYSSLDPRMSIGATVAEAMPRGTSGAERRKEVARLLDVPQNTMSSHLSVLTRAGLISSERHSRSIIFRAELDKVREVASFLVTDCCGGRPELCEPLVAEFTPCCTPSERDHAC